MKFGFKTLFHFALVNFELVLDSWNTLISYVLPATVIRIIIAIQTFSVFVFEEAVFSLVIGIFKALLPCLPGTEVSLLEQRQKTPLRTFYSKPMCDVYSLSLCNMCFYCTVSCRSLLTHYFACIHEIGCSKMCTHKKCPCTCMLLVYPCLSLALTSTKEGEETFLLEHPVYKYMRKRCLGR